MPRQIVRDFGTCLNYNGGSSVAILKVGTILAGQTNASISVWLNTTRIPPNGSTIPAIYCERAGSGNDIFKVEITTAGVVRLTYRDDAGTLNQPVGTIAINNGQWHHLVFIKNGTSVKTYIDTVLDMNGTLTATNAFTNAGMNASLGKDVADSSTYYFNYLDELSLYTRALSAGEVSDLYYTGTTANQATNLVGYYKMDEGSGSSLTDSSGTQAAGTLTSLTYSTAVFMKPRLVAP